MGYTAYFQRGKYKLELNATPYMLHESFMPPAVAEIANISEGTSANQYGGSSLVDKRAISANYIFTVRISSTTSGAVESYIKRLDNFVRSGSEADSVYFYYKPNNNVDIEPLFGQWNATERCKVVNGNAYLSGMFYGTSELRGKRAYADVTLLINPPEGARQRVGLAIGGIMEDIVGSPDGVSRGLIVPRGPVNEITNPIFGHATWNTGWTADAGLDATQNTEADYVLFGNNSARLVNRNVAATKVFYQSPNVGDTNTYTLSAYAKRSDGAAVSGNDCALFYGSAQTTAYTSVGDGWYRMTATVTGIAAATSTGVVVGTGRSVFVDGVQIETGTYAYATPLSHGGMLGCTWAGTAHESTNTRAAATLKYPVGDITRSGYGTIWIAWRAPAAHTSYAADGYIFYIYSAANPFYLYWDYANLRWRLSDGTNTINYTDTITAGELFIFHCVYGPSSMKLYINGAEVATGAAYTPPSGQDYLYVGTSVSATGHIGGTFHGLGTYRYALSATEVLADYNNMLPVAQGIDGLGGLVSALPWMYTKDGDNVVDNCDDSTRDNWGVVGGVPGSLPADTEFHITTNENSEGIHYLVLHPGKEFVLPTSQNYYDAQGTADAGCSGGEYLALSSSYGYASYTPANPAEFSGSVHFLARTKAVSAPVFINGTLTYTTTVTAGTTAARTDDLSMATDTTWNLYYIGKLNWQYDSESLLQVTAAVEHGSGVQHLDYFMAIPGNLAVITDPIGSMTIFYLHGRKVYSSTTGYLSVTMTGDVIELEPQRINTLWFLQGLNSATSTITSTATFVIYVTPRWALA